MVGQTSYRSRGKTGSGIFHLTVCSLSKVVNNLVPKLKELSLSFPSGGVTLARGEWEAKTWFQSPSRTACIVVHATWRGCSRVMQHMLCTYKCEGATLGCFLAVFAAPSPAHSYSPGTELVSDFAKHISELSYNSN